LWIRQLRFYEVDQLTEIVTRSAKVLDTVIDAEEAAEIARRTLRVYTQVERLCTKALRALLYRAFRI